MRQTILSDVSPHSPHAGVPPPPLDIELVDIELVDAGRGVGWIADARIGFRGFASDTEAVHAAWVAWRGLQRRAARRLGVRPVPVDAEPLTIRRSDTRETILAGTRPIGTLLRPGTDTRTGPDSFAFELQLSASTGELGLRAKAYVVYRALRKSGVRWALWRPAIAPAPTTITETSTALAASDRRPTDRTVAAVATANPAAVRRLDDDAPTTGRLPEVMALRARVTFTAIAVAAGLALLAMVSPILIAPLALFLLSPFLAVRLLVRLDQRKARRHALRKAGSAARDLAAMRVDDCAKLVDAREVSASDPAGSVGWRRRIASTWNRSVVPQRTLREQRAWRRRHGVRGTSVAMPVATLAALALVVVDRGEVILALASVGALAFIGVAALRLSVKRKRWAQLPSRTGFTSAIPATRASRSERSAYRGELHTKRRRSHEES